MAPKIDLLLSRLSSNAEKSPNKVAVAFLSKDGKEQAKLTYQKLQDEVVRVALLLKDRGVKAGDCVVIVYPPSIDFMVGFLACLKLGAICVPVFPPNPLRRDTIQMFAKIVKTSEARYALTNGEYNHNKKMASLKETLRVNKKLSASVAWPDGLQWIVTDSSSKTGLDADQVAWPVPKASTIAFLQFTSGSTSDPKGVMISHGNLGHNLHIITRQLEAKDDTVVVSWLPNYHDMGLIGSFLGALYCGGSGYYLSPLTFLQRPRLWMESVSKYRATHLQVPNFALGLTARKCDTTDGLDLTSIRHIINAAEPVTDQSIKAFREKFEPAGLQAGVIFPTYGLAEHTVFVCSNGQIVVDVDKHALEVDRVVQVVTPGGEPNAQQVTRLFGCGKPSMQDVEVRIVDPDKEEEVPPNGVGEIWISSPSKARGYYNKVEETKASFEAKLPNSTTEYLRTGDLGFIYEDELFICGRLKDLIIVGGRNYYPQDIEFTAESATDLVRLGCSAAFSIDPTNSSGEEVALVMELKEVPSNAKEVCEPLAQLVKSTITSEHSLAIASIVFLQPKTVPKTTSGKIARAWCRKAYLGNTLKQVYRKSFRSSQIESMEIDSSEAQTPSNGAAGSNGNRVARDSVATIRKKSNKEIRKLLQNDIAQLSSLDASSVAVDVPLVSMMDSLTLSQFKGLLESHYGVSISDEYLFRESVNVTKLVEVVKLGYAPDDGSGSGNTYGHGSSPSGAGSAPGQASGLAGALGCPPGVICTIL